MTQLSVAEATELCKTRNITTERSFTEADVLCREHIEDVPLGGNLMCMPCGEWSHRIRCTSCMSFWECPDYIS